MFHSVRQAKLTRTITIRFIEFSYFTKDKEAILQNAFVIISETQNIQHIVIPVTTISRQARTDNRVNFSS